MQNFKKLENYWQFCMFCGSGPSPKNLCLTFWSILHSSNFFPRSFRSKRQKFWQNSHNSTPSTLHHLSILEHSVHHNIFMDSVQWRALDCICSYDRRSINHDDLLIFDSLTLVLKLNIEIISIKIYLSNFGTPLYSLPSSHLSHSFHFTFCTPLYRSLLFVHIHTFILLLFHSYVKRPNQL